MTLVFPQDGGILTPFVALNLLKCYCAVLRIVYREVKKQRFLSHPHIFHVIIHTIYHLVGMIDTGEEDQVIFSKESGDIYFICSPYQIFQYKKW